MIIGAYNSKSLGACRQFRFFWCARGREEVQLHTKFTSAANRESRTMNTWKLAARSFGIRRSSYPGVESVIGNCCYLQRGYISHSLIPQENTRDHADLAGVNKATRGRSISILLFIGFPSKIQAFPRVIVNHLGYLQHTLGRKYNPGLLL